MMTETNAYSKIEIFHLIFLRYLEHLLPKSSYALKGGCNLRFFFNSIRYSEDIDLDVWEISKEKLQERVEKVLSSKDLKMALIAQSVELVNIRAHKQTDTTQRWKMALEIGGHATAFPTKIEFSRQEDRKVGAIELSQVNSVLTSGYNLAPLLITHYKGPEAFAQKLQALLLRRETQARDIFDSYYLAQNGVVPNWSRTQEKYDTLVERILSLDFSTFSSQVVAFLQPGYQAFFQEPDKWEEIQLALIQYLEKLQ